MSDPPPSVYVEPDGTWRGAFFSTEGHSRPPREAGNPKPSPVARSNPEKDTKEIIARLRAKWPIFCYSIFPQWDIRWFWDEYDFYTLGPKFAYDLIYTMMKENEEHAAQFAKLWSNSHQHLWPWASGPEYCTVESVFHKQDRERLGDFFLEKALILVKQAMGKAKEEFHQQMAEIHAKRVSFVKWALENPGVPCYDPIPDYSNIGHHPNAPPYPMSAPPPPNQPSQYHHPHGQNMLYVPYVPQQAHNAPVGSLVCVGNMRDMEPLDPNAPPPILPTHGIIPFHSTTPWYPRHMIAEARRAAGIVTDQDTAPVVASSESVHSSETLHVQRPRPQSGEDGVRSEISAAAAQLGRDHQSSTMYREPSSSTPMKTGFVRNNSTTVDRRVPFPNHGIQQQQHLRENLQQYESPNPYRQGHRKNSNAERARRNSGATRRGGGNGRGGGGGHNFLKYPTSTSGDETRGLQQTTFDSNARFPPTATSAAIPTRMPRSPPVITYPMPPPDGRFRSAWAEQVDPAATHSTDHNDPKMAIGPDFIGEDVEDVFQLWIGNIEDASPKDLFDTFNIIVPVHFVNVHINKTAGSNPYAWIHFHSTADVRKVLAHGPIRYQGRSLIVQTSIRCRTTNVTQNRANSQRNKFHHHNYKWSGGREWSSSPTTAPTTSSAINKTTPKRDEPLLESSSTCYSPQDVRSTLVPQQEIPASIALSPSHNPVIQRTVAKPESVDATITTEKGKQPNSKIEESVPNSVGSSPSTHSRKKKSPKKKIVKQESQSFEPKPQSPTTSRLMEAKQDLTYGQAGPDEDLFSQKDTKVDQPKADKGDEDTAKTKSTTSKSSEEQNNSKEAQHTTLNKGKDTVDNPQLDTKEDQTCPKIVKPNDNHDEGIHDFKGCSSPTLKAEEIPLASSKGSADQDATPPFEESNAYVGGTTISKPIESRLSQNKPSEQDESQSKQWEDQKKTSARNITPALPLVSKLSTGKSPPPPPPRPPLGTQAPGQPCSTQIPEQTIKRQYAEVAAQASGVATSIATAAEGIELAHSSSSKEVNHSSPGNPQKQSAASITLKNNQLAFSKSSDNSAFPPKGKATKENIKTAAENPSIQAKDETIGSRSTNVDSSSQQKPLRVVYQQQQSTSGTRSALQPKNEKTPQSIVKSSPSPTRETSTTTLSSSPNVGKGEETSATAEQLLSRNDQVTLNEQEPRMNENKISSSLISDEKSPSTSDDSSPVAEKQQSFKQSPKPLSDLRNWKPEYDKVVQLIHREFEDPDRESRMEEIKKLRDSIISNETKISEGDAKFGKGGSGQEISKSQKKNWPKKRKSLNAAHNELVDDLMLFEGKISREIEFRQVPQEAIQAPMFYRKAQIDDDDDDDNDEKIPLPKILLLYPRT